VINTRTEWWRARKLEELPANHLPHAPVEDWAEQHADRALLMDIIKTLPPQQLSVLVLRYWEQMSTDETATVRVPKTPSMICDLQILTNGQ
jgi:DNA-directed RNA polymerase specialized sigma24 family protein